MPHEVFAYKPTCFIFIIVFSCDILLTLHWQQWRLYLGRGNRNWHCFFRYLLCRNFLHQSLFLHGFHNCPLMVFSSLSICMFIMISAFCGLVWSTPQSQFLFLSAFCWVLASPQSYNGPPLKWPALGSFSRHPSFLVPNQTREHYNKI